MYGNFLPFVSLRTLALGIALLIFGADQCRAIRAGISTHCRSRRHALQGRVGGLEGNYPQSAGTSFETDDKKEPHPADRERYRLLFDILGQNTGASL